MTMLYVNRVRTHPPTHPPLEQYEHQNLIFFKADRKGNSIPTAKRQKPKEPNPTSVTLVS